MCRRQAADSIAGPPCGGLEARRDRDRPLSRARGSGGTMAVSTITSVQNPRVKDAVRLRDSRYRAKQGRLVVYGARELLQALRGQTTFVELFLCADLCKSPDAQEVLA